MITSHPSICEVADDNFLELMQPHKTTLVGYVNYCNLLTGRYQVGRCSWRI